MYNGPMREKIKLWLKTTKRDRHWLAEQCQVNKRTVDNWLSAGQKITPTCERLIQSMMDADAAEAEKAAQAPVIPNGVLVLEVDGNRFESYSQAALHHQKTLSGWAISELDRAALYHQNQRNMAAAADDLVMVADQHRAAANAETYSGEPKPPVASIVPDASPDAPGVDAKGL